MGAKCLSWSAAVSPPAYGGYTFAYPNAYAAWVPQRRVCSPLVDCTGTVTVRGQATPNPVSEGQYLNYTFYVRNDDSQKRIVNMVAMMDPATRFGSATFGGMHDGNTVRWTGLTIPAGASRTLVLRVLVRGDAFDRSIALRVQTNHSTDRVETTVEPMTVFVPNAYAYPSYGQSYGYPYAYEDRRPYHDEYRSRNYYNSYNSYSNYYGSLYNCDPSRFRCD